MICSKCGKNVATVHYKQTVNGVTQEALICDSCASKLQKENIISMPGFHGFGGSFSDLLGSFFMQHSAQQKSVQPPYSKETNSEVSCTRCGLQLSDLLKRGEVGCADCYECFRTELKDVIRRVHGPSAHTGKIPASAGEKVRAAGILRDKKNLLAAAIEAQRFEEAASLRDEIRELEKEAGTSEH